MMDIDIDFANRDQALELFDHVIAARNNNGQMVNHATGIYFQSIPHNPITKLSTLDYQEAEARGYFKIDFLNVHIYDQIKDQDHLEQLMEAHIDTHRHT